MKGTILWGMTIIPIMGGICQRMGRIQHRSDLAGKHTLATLPLLRKVDQGTGPNQTIVPAWDMVTVTYDGTNNLLIYLNAAIQQTTNSFASPAPSSKPLIFGFGTANTNGPSDYDGDMWLPQIWSTNLSPSDIANLFQQQKFGIPWP